MSLESDILADFRQLLIEHGVAVKWKTLDLAALASRAREEQQIEMGGFVSSPDLSLRLAKQDFSGPPPKFGERIEVAGTTYRIAKVGNHPRSPLLTLSLSSTDE
jgi:hypothetical protein